MSMSVRCSGCGAKFSADERIAGKRVKCPKCQTTFKVPPVDTPAHQQPTESGAEAPAAPPAGGIGDLLDEWDEAGKAGAAGGGYGAAGEAAADRCPTCGAPLKPETVLCVQCGYHRAKGVQMATVRDKPPPPSKAYDGPGGNPYASPRAGEYDDSDTGFLPSLESEPAWEGGGTMGAYIATIKSVIIDPRHTFTNIVLKGDWQQPASFAICTYLIDFLGWMLLDAVGHAWSGR